jgi:hypothetical protein
MQYVCKNQYQPHKRDTEGNVIEKHPDYCDRIFLYESPNFHVVTVQNWKYCPVCEAKGFEQLTLLDRPPSPKGLCNNIAKHNASK